MKAILNIIVGILVIINMISWNHGVINNNSMIVIYTIINIITIIKILESNYKKA